MPDALMPDLPTAEVVAPPEPKKKGIKKGGKGLGAAMAGGNAKNGTKKNEFYGTPVDVTLAMLNGWRPPCRRIAEVACGDGAMSRVLEAHGYEVLSSDLIDRGYGQVRDFLAMTEAPAPCLITNPPFSLAEKFVKHAFAIGFQSVALVLKGTYWHGGKRYRSLYRQHRPSLIMPLLWRPDFSGDGNPTMELAIVVWDSPHSLMEPSMRPLPRPDKAQLSELEMALSIGSTVSPWPIPEWVEDDVRRLAAGLPAMGPSLEDVSSTAFTTLPAGWREALSRAGMAPPPA